MSNARQELYDRIRASSKDEVQLAEMERLGFWDPKAGPNQLPTELIERSGELSRKLQKLVAEDRHLQNRENALAHVRKERLKESRERQKANKEKREAERIARAEAWQEKKKSEILFLGETQSGSLNKLIPNEERLAKHNLPNFYTHLDLARAMDISIGELRFLSYHRNVSKISHYKRFLIPKKAGGTRLISAPMPRLKAAQHWILENVLSLVPLHEAAHGFRTDRSIVTNAKPHEGSTVVINLDLKDFFPNVTLPRVYGLFHSLGYSQSVATILSLLCTEPPVQNAALDGETWHVATGVRHLPQGAPTSPTITNLLCRRLDARLTGIAKKHGYTYTRYADDLTFSSKSADSRSSSRKVLWHVRKVVEEEGFIVHPEKVHTMGPGRRQEVTGLTVNDTCAVPRQDLRAFRSLLHHLETKGPDHCSWRGSTDRILAKVDGYSSYLKMVDPQRYTKVCQKAQSLLAKHNFRPANAKPPKSLLGKLKSLFGK